MGSKGSKKRKPTKHLPKVGTPQERAWEQHEARHDVTHAMGGPSGSSEGSKVFYWVIGAIAVLLLAMAVVALVALD